MLTLSPITGFNSNELFDISQDCETESVRRKIFGKICV